MIYAKQSGVRFDGGGSGGQGYRYRWFCKWWSSRWIIYRGWSARRCGMLQLICGRCSIGDGDVMLVRYFLSYTLLWLWYIGGISLLLLESRRVLSVSMPFLLVYLGVMLFLLLFIIGEDNSFFGVNVWVRMGEDCSRCDDSFCEEDTNMMSHFRNSF